jgi:two-component system, chemotaxis family, response regulator Rcp1
MSGVHAGGQLELLLVEDNAADVRLVREGLSVFPSKYHLTVVSDGEAAIDYLKRRGKYSVAARPSLVLLDLNLPKKDGLEVLREVKSDPNLKKIPVMVLTSSNSERDVTAAYELGANSYVRKAGTLDEIYGIMRSIYDFWVCRVVLPDFDQTE